MIPDAVAKAARLSAQTQREIPSPLTTIQNAPNPKPGPGANPHIQLPALPPYINKSNLR